MKSLLAVKDRVQHEYLKAVRVIITLLKFFQHVIFSIFLN
jgi:hypothetical protein